MAGPVEIVLERGLTLLLSATLTALPGSLHRPVADFAFGR